MFCPNKIPNNVLTEMRKQQLELQKHMKYYQTKYSEESKAVNVLQKQYFSQRKKNIILQQQIQKLKTSLKIKRKVEHQRKPKAIKKWFDIKSNRTKHRRVASFKDLLLDTLQNMKVCHRAEMTLWLEDNKINLSFSPSEIANNNACQKEKSGHKNNIFSDHSYSTLLTEPEEIENFHDLDYSEIYDSSGKWKKNI